MKLGYLLLFAAIVSLVYAIWLVVSPASLFSLYGVDLNDSSQLMGWFFAAALFALGLVAWFARGVGESACRKAVVPAFLVGALAGLIVSWYGVYTGLMNTTGWSVVIIYLLLLLGFAYAQLKKA